MLYTEFKKEAKAAGKNFIKKKNNMQVFDIFFFI